MRLRTKIILYVAVIHQVFAASAIVVLWEHRLWWLVVEAFFVFSFVYGLQLIRASFAPIEMVRTGADLITESEFTSRFLEVGHPDIDQLIRVYNRMVDHLRDERVRLQEQHYFLDKVLNASPSGIVTFDYDERIALVNPSAERTLQWPGDRLKGKKLSEINTLFAEALGRLSVGESQVVPLQGRRRVKCRKSQFLDQGFPRGFIVMEELTEELRRSERAAYEKLIRLLSHEVNNTIGAIGSLLQSCLNYKGQLRSGDQKDYETALHVSISRAAHLNSFMRQFADVVRLPPPERHPCDVRALLEDIAFLMKPESQKRNIAWAWDVQGALDAVLMDKNQMEQVFMNVIKNSIEAIGENGTITIRMGQEGGRGFVIVEDTGGGLSPEVRPHLFTPFFSTKENGQGIGLTVVQEVLSQHGFEFSLEGQPGRPTQFTVHF